MGWCAGASAPEESVENRPSHAPSTSSATTTAPVIPELCTAGRDPDDPRFTQ